jgi:DNA polymerase zeta
VDFLCINSKNFEHRVVAPNGIIYVKKEVRQGLLGRMLSELLDSRVMVKHAMKGAKDDKVTHFTIARASSDEEPL